MVYVCVCSQCLASYEVAVSHINHKIHNFSAENFSCNLKPRSVYEQVIITTSATGVYFLFYAVQYKPDGWLVLSQYFATATNWTSVRKRYICAHFRVTNIFSPAAFSILAYRWTDTSKSERGNAKLTSTLFVLCLALCPRPWSKTQPAHFCSLDNHASSCSWSVYVIARLSSTVGIIHSWSADLSTLWVKRI